MVSFDSFTPGPLQKLSCFPGYDNVFIKRLDLIKSWATGNKYYKLKENFREILRLESRVIVTKGGMFSNHLEATSAACKNFDLECICIVRSYKDDPGNPTLKRIKEYGAEIICLEPDSYKAYNEVSAQKDFPGCYFVPEGGANESGIKGSVELLKECQQDGAQHIIIAGGTMSTAAGMISAAGSVDRITIVAAWKGSSVKFISSLLQEHSIDSYCPWELWPDFHFGGFGKYNEALVEFMMKFLDQTSIPLDPVYTGKLLYAVDQKIKSREINPELKTVIIHTGGLQGIAGAVYRDQQLWGRYGSMSDFNQL